MAINKEQHLLQIQIRTNNNNNLKQNNHKIIEKYLRILEIYNESNFQKFRVKILKILNNLLKKDSLNNIQIKLDLNLLNIKVTILNILSCKILLN